MIIEIIEIIIMIIEIIIKIIKIIINNNNMMTQKEIRKLDLIKIIIVIGYIIKKKILKVIQINQKIGIKIEINSKKIIIKEI